MRTRALSILAMSLALGSTGFSEEVADQNTKVLRAGIIGLDTSHVVAFTQIFNNPEKKSHVKVVAAYPGGSPDLPISADRVEGFTNTLREKHGVEIVDSIDELLQRVDVVLLESVDGRCHLEQARPVIEAGKPLFVDKPIASSLADAIEIFSLAKQHKVPCFSSSSLRFDDMLQKLREGKTEIGAVVRCEASGPNPNTVLKGHPDLAFYGIHGIEMLFTVLGTGCKTVTLQSDGVVKGEWNDGRIGTYSPGDMRIAVTGTKGAVESKGGGYSSLVAAIAKFFETGEPPVPSEETIELFAFIEAAQKSKDNGNAPVAIAEVMAEARKSRSK